MSISGIGMHHLTLVMVVKTKQDRNFRDGMHLLTLFMGVKIIKQDRNIWDTSASPQSYHGSEC
jgi:hypothetical protein